MRRFTGLAMALMVPAILAAQRSPVIARPTLGRLPQPAPPPVVPRPAPIGGLATRPLSPYPAASGHGTTRSLRPEPPYRASRVGTYPYRTFRRGVYPLAVVDAPYPRLGVVAPPHVGEPVRQDEPSGRLWTPTVDKPRWRVDSTERPVQAWRDLVVTDVVCTPDGDCVQRERKTRAPWVAACRCYAFRDALGRAWRVE